MKSIALVGCGGWGKNHARTLSTLGVLGMACDASQKTLDSLRLELPGVDLVTDIQKVFDNENITGIVIATPPITHAELTIKALRAGKDVLVEKPMALKSSDAEAMNLEAKKLNRILMVGHV